MLYAISDRGLYAEKNADALRRLVELAAMWAANGVSFIQIREKDLPAGEQVDLARAVIRAVRRVNGKTNATRVLIHGRADVALASGAHGVHLPSGDDALTPEEIRSIFRSAGQSQPAVISVSCHTIEEVMLARQGSPDCILFAPVFEKVIRERHIGSDPEENRSGSLKLPGTGLALLKQACRAAAPVPVFALGGANAENAADCRRAGAAGIAAIRLMQEPVSSWKHLV
ncbi:MAG TPA: thiamine phosphate synthase [Acidobacteriaceae bacterium]|nr:thiamine phosphate synthase [Acidobacteriaceae bacterium]